MKTKVLHITITVLLVSAVAVAQSTPVADPCANGPLSSLVVNWQQIHFKICHTGYNPYEHLLSIGNVGNLVQSWADNLGVTDSGPVLANGIVYVNGGGNVFAVKASNGAQLWSFNTGGANSESSPAVANGFSANGNGFVYDASMNGLFALNAQAGTLVWVRQDLGEFTASPSVANGVVYAATNSAVYAFNGLSGTVKWQHADISVSAFASPTVSNGLLYIGDQGSGLVYALNANTGDQVWQYQTGGSVWGAAAVDEGVVYVASFDKNLYALDAATGAFLWKYPTGGQPDTTPAVANGIVYIGSGIGNSDTTFYAINAADGTLKWKYMAGAGFDNSSAAVANGVVYVGSGEGSIYAFDAATGAKLLSLNFGSAIYSSPIVANGTLYFSARTQSLYAYRLP